MAVSFFGVTNTLSRTTPNFSTSDFSDPDFSIPRLRKYFSTMEFLTLRMKCPELKSPYLGLNRPEGFFFYYIENKMAKSFPFRKKKKFSCLKYEKFQLQICKSGILQKFDKK